MMTKHDRVQQLRQTALDLAEAVANPTTGDEVFAKYLEWISRFHSYSFGNIALILSQKPDSTYVAGYKTWQQLGRQVRGGEKGIAILVPMRTKPRTELDPESQEERTVPGRLFFGVGHVFDVSQTDGLGEDPCQSDLGGDAELLLLATRMVAEKAYRVVSRPCSAPQRLQRDWEDRAQRSSAWRPGTDGGARTAHECCTTKTSVDCRPPSSKAKQKLSRSVLRHSASTWWATVRHIRAHGASGEVILRSLDRITTAARTIIEGITLQLPAVQQMTAQAEMVG